MRCRSQPVRRKVDGPRYHDPTADRGCPILARFDVAVNISMILYGISLALSKTVVDCKDVREGTLQWVQIKIPSGKTR